MTGAADAEEVANWVRFAQTSGVGPETARKLLAAFGLPDKIFAADFATLRTVVSERVARALLAAPSDQVQALIERTVDWAAQAGNRLLTLSDPDYPPLLLNIPDPPLMLHVAGRLELLTRPSLAVVGSRNATAQGVANAERFSEALSQHGWTIVSGLALGIDTAAHNGGLRGEGATIAIIGTGADLVYPARNRALSDRIARDGCIVSEYPLGMPVLPANFPRRNRIISGLARGVLVVEAAAQSGSLITARMAGDQGREVFAIPGSIHSSLSKGCHQLIKQGAKLVESAQDIIEEIGSQQTTTDAAASATFDTSAVDATDHPLLSSMGFDPVDIDQLCLRLGLDAADVNAQLLILEMEGKVEALPGGKYRRLV